MLPPIKSNAQSKRTDSDLTPAVVDRELRLAPQTWATEVRTVRSQVVNSYTLGMTAVPDVAKYESLGGIVAEIPYGGHTFVLTRPLHLSIRHEDGYWFHEHQELGISAYGETLEESLQTFYLQFDADWEAYAEEDDGKLTEGAQELKRQLRGLVEVIRT